MKKAFLSTMILLMLFTINAQAKDLVVYFSAQGHTQAVAEEIANIMNADILRIEAARPYADNPYDDSDRIQNEAYNDLRPEVANLPDAAVIAGYDRIFVGSPCWWHQPAMVVCTFLESYDLADKTIIPFFTYGATTYLNESMQKIYKVTPDSKHIPETLPEDLHPGDITTPGPSDDAGIDMPGNARGVEAWLKRLGLLGSTSAIASIETEDEPFRIYKNGSRMQITVTDGSTNNAVRAYNANGALIVQMENSNHYTLPINKGSIYLISVSKGIERKGYTYKVMP